MTVGSTIPSAIDQLVAILTAETGSGGALEGVPIIDGFPGDKAEREIIVVGAAEPDSEAPHSLGNRSRDETYKIRITTNVIKRDTVKAARDRAFALDDRVQTLLRPSPGNVLQDPAMHGGTGHFLMVGIVAAGYVAMPSSDGVEVEVRLDVEVQARI